MIRRIVSGGQAGVDRAALDVARAWDLPYGGWVPAGRLAEDGVIPDHYQGLVETGSARAAVRTRCNVRDSDGTLLISHGPLRGGSQLAQRWAHRLGRPELHVDLSRTPLEDALDRCLAWLDGGRVATLNVAGPRASEDVNGYTAALVLLSALLALTRTPRGLAFREHLQQNR